MKKHILRLGALIALMLFLSYPCISQDIEGEFLFAKHLNDVLGTWEDGKGAIITIKKLPEGWGRPNSPNVSISIEQYTHWSNFIQKETKNHFAAFGEDKYKYFIKDSTFNGKTFYGHYFNYDKTSYKRPFIYIQDSWGVVMLVFDFQNGILANTTEKFITDKTPVDEKKRHFTNYYPTTFKRTKKFVEESVNDNETESALKVTPSKIEIKPDGQSTAEISAVLYEYIPDDNSFSKPLSGKTLTFKIQEMDGVKPGTLSSATAVTDVNGVAKVVYTAPTAQLLEKMQAFNRISTAVTVKNVEAKVEDLAYINFLTDNGKMWAEPGMHLLSDTAFVPPDRRYPAMITANFLDDNLEPISNTEVVFSIKESNPVGMLRNSQGREGKTITTKTDASGVASVYYYYAAASAPQKPITETIEAKTKNMVIPFKAYVTTGLNIVLENAESGYEGSKDVNANEEVPLKITVKDEWNPNMDLEKILSYWGVGNGSGDKHLNVKLEIKKQGFVPNYMLDLMGEQNYPEPLYEELLIPKNLKGAKNLLYITEYSLKKKGYPVVKPKFSGNNNYEIKVSLVDEKGVTVFESSHPRAVAYISIPTGIAADAFSIWFASNPLGPHTENARFFRMVLGTVTFGKLGGFGSIISLVDAAYAINKGDAEALANIMISEIKGAIISDKKEKAGLTGELFAEYEKMSIMEQYVSYAVNSGSDKGLIAQMEGKIISGIAYAGFGAKREMVVLKGNGSQKLFAEGVVKPQSKLSKTIKDNIKITGIKVDKKTSDFFKKISDKKSSASRVLIPVREGAFFHDKDLDVYSLKNGSVTIYSIPATMKVTSENTVEMKTY